MNALQALSTLALLAASPAAEVTLFRGVPGGVGDVLVVDEAGAAAPTVPAGLSQVRLLPIEVAGRTRIDAFLPDRARRLEDVVGASRLLLPAGHGSLYRYVRGGVASSLYGFFLVDADGVARVLIERVGTGPDLAVDPFVDRVSVAPAGDAFLVATTPEDGGDVFEVSIAGNVQNRSSAVAPMGFSGPGLRLLGTWGVAAGPEGVLRFERGAPGSGAVVPLPGAPAWFSGEVAASPSGTLVVTTAGQGPLEAFVYTLAQTGPAQQSTASPMDLSPAGYLPEHAGGPFLAVDDAGTSVAFRTEGAVSREAWIAPGAGGSFQLTADSLFLDTLDQAGVMRYQGSKLMLAVGETADPLLGGIEGFDVYAVDSTATPSITNITQTNGLASPPFTVASNISAEDGMYTLPDGQRVILHDSQSGSGELLALDLAAATSTVLLDAVKSLDAFEIAGDHAFASIRREGATTVRQLLSIDLATLTPTVLATMSETVVVDRVAGRADGTVGFVVGFGAAEWMARVDLAAGTGGFFLPFGLAYGPALGFAPGGSLVFTGGVIPGVPGWPLAWDPTVPSAALLEGAPATQVLPGA